MTTIRDVASMAGVSVGTVSNMINGKGTISDDKYERIKSAMDTLNYKPNFMAKNLRTQKNKVLGIILPNLEEPYNDIYEGIADLLDLHNYITVLKLTQNNIVLENQFLDQLVGMGVVGIIIVPSDCNNNKKYEELQRNGIAMVFLERKLTGLDTSTILFENKKIIYGITQKLMEDKPESIIKLVVGKQEFTSELDCSEGYLAAREKHEHDIVVIEETRKEAIFNQIYSRMLNFEQIPDYMIASSLEFAKIILEVCNILNYQIDIHAIVGENWYTTDLYLHLNLYGRNAILMGKQASKLLLGMLGRKELVENGTTYIKLKTSYQDAVLNTAAQSGSTIKILAFQSNMVDAMEKLSFRFTNITGIKFEFDKREYTQLRKELNSQVENEMTDYDIVMIDIPWLKSMIGKDYLMNMSKAAKEDELLQYYPSGVRTAFYKGDRGVHIFPIIATVQTIMYRKDIFQNRDIKAQFKKLYGYELAPPQTWTNFNNIAEFFDRRFNPNSPFEYGTAASSLEPVGLINEFLPRQWAFKGNIIDKWGELSIDSEENVRALDNLVKTFEHTPEGMEGYFWDEIFELLLKGKIPIAQGFASHYQPGNYSQKGDTYEKYISGIQLPGGKTMLGGWALGITRHSKNSEACYEFIKWILSDKSAISGMRLGGCIPTVSAFRDETLRSSYQWLNLVNEKFNTGGLREEIFDSNRNAISLEIVDKILSKSIKQAIRKETDTNSALKQIKQELVKVLTNK